MSVPDLLFIGIGICACAFALLMVTSRNTFHCVIWLSLTLLSIAGVYFYLGAEFLGTIQILVYIGGIITLFVFAIKLTARIDDESIPQTNSQIWPALFICILTFIVQLKIIGAHPWTQGQGTPGSTPLKGLGKALMTTYALPFEFISLVLLAALVGAIVIGKVKK